MRSFYVHIQCSSLSAGGNGPSSLGTCGSANPGLACAAVEMEFTSGARYL